MRPSKEEYYLSIALDVAKRSTCLRTGYGSCIVNNDSIVSTGYNGAPRGTPNCIDIGLCARTNIPSRMRYELCRAVHAETNSLLNASSRADVVGARIYIAGFDARIFYETGEVIEKLGEQSYPCMMCYRNLVNARVAEVCIKGNAGNPVVHSLQFFSFLDEVDYGEIESSVVACSLT